MNALLSETQALEVELHHPGARCDAARLRQLLHEDFHEVGRSGRAYDRDTVVRFLSAQDSPPPVVSDDFALCVLAPGVALLTYRSAHRRADGGLENHTLRSSVWVRAGEGWQLRYHQGTPAAQPWQDRPLSAPGYQEVLTFWFEETRPASWWSAEPDFDDLVRRRFLPVLQRAAAGECAGWRGTPEGRLAEIVVLDQFSRNIHRGTARAFAQDPMALVLAQEAVAQGALASLTPVQRSFLLLPYMHSESQAVHQQAEVLYRQHAPEENHQFELRHKAIIDRFGRYPHRNEVLGRESTPQELAFLKEPGSRF